MYIALGNVYIFNNVNSYNPGAENILLRLCVFQFLLFMFCSLQCRFYTSLNLFLGILFDSVVNKINLFSHSSLLV